MNCGKSDGESARTGAAATLAALVAPAHIPAHPLAAAAALAELLAHGLSRTLERAIARRRAADFAPGTVGGCRQGQLRAAGGQQTAQASHQGAPQIDLVPDEGRRVAAAATATYEFELVAVRVRQIADGNFCWVMVRHSKMLTRVQRGPLAVDDNNSFTPSICDRVRTFEGPERSDFRRRRARAPPR